MSNQTVENQSFKISKKEATGLDQLVQILEISFIFLLVYSLITLIDASFEIFNLYRPLSDQFLGERDVGSLSGGQFEAIVRITIVFNLLLFSFSLFFGMWIRYTRDGWSFEKLGFTLHTPNYSFINIVVRGLLLGLLAVVIQFTIMTAAVWYKTGDLTEGIMAVQVYTQSDGTMFSEKQLYAEYYFGIIEMGFIWPMSAGFFFFAYAYNSLKAKFPQGVANILATLFYVFYLAFFFMIIGSGKLERIATQPENYVANLIFWSQLLVFFIILYISFSAFAETNSIVLPFLLNFVFNVGLTVFRAGNTLLFDGFSYLMLVPYITSVLILLVILVIKREYYSTVKSGLQDLKGIKQLRLSYLLGFTFLFVLFSLITPGFLEFVISKQDNIPRYVVLTIGALYYVVIIIFAIIILTYEPTKVYDVLLINKDGRPIASHIELFTSDDVLISGFFTALSSVSTEIDASASGLSSVKQGEREILIEEGVMTRLIALADRDQPSIRNSITRMHKKFETKYKEEIENWNGMDFPVGTKLVNDIGELSIRFNIPQQTRWISSLTIVFAPIFIILLGLL